MGDVGLPAFVGLQASNLVPADRGRLRGVG
jgi:hypothetical protein